MQRTFIALGLSLLTISGASAYTPMTGDVVFHTSTSAQSAAVQAATHSPYSHMGIVIQRGGKPFVLEAVQPVKYTAPGAWLDRGKGRHYVIKRTRAPLLPAAVAQLEQEARHYVGKPYDLAFAWSDERIYCSELVWKLYKSAGIELAPLAKLGSFDLASPVVRRKLEERYHGRIPADEPVIAPAAIFASEQLVTVAER